MRPLRFRRSGALAATFFPRVSRAVVGGHFGLPSGVPLAGSIALLAMGHGRAHASLCTLADPAIQIAQRGGDGIKPVPQADLIEGLAFHSALPRWLPRCLPFSLGSKCSPPGTTRSKLCHLVAPCGANAAIKPCRLAHLITECCLRAPLAAFRHPVRTTWRWSYRGPSWVSVSSTQAPESSLTTCSGRVALLDSPPCCPASPKVWTYGQIDGPTPVYARRAEKGV